MNSLPKMHKTSTGKRFIVPSKKCSTKALSKGVINALKLVFNQIHSFHKKSHFYSDYKNLCVDKTSQLVIDRLNIINTKQNAKLISTFEFSTLYTKLPQKDLLKVLFHLVNLVLIEAHRKK